MRYIKLCSWTFHTCELQFVLEPDMQSSPKSNLVNSWWESLRNSWYHKDTAIYWEKNTRSRWWKLRSSERKHKVSYIYIFIFFAKQLCKSIISLKEQLSHVVELFFFFFLHVNPRDLKQGISLPQSAMILSHILTLETRSHIRSACALSESGIRLLEFHFLRFLF